VLKREEGKKEITLERYSGLVEIWVQPSIYPNMRTPTLASITERKQPERRGEVCHWVNDPASRSIVT
jgi:hypothetical protein